MTRDEITHMAREAGFVGMDGDHGALRRFAALVAAAEREKVAAWMIQRSDATGHGDTTEDLLKELEWQIRESEREACAKVCEVLRPFGPELVLQKATAEDCAAAIRARGDSEAA